MTTSQSGGVHAELIIDTEIEFRDSTLFLSENITILEGGSLTITNTTIQFNCNFPLQYGIVVEAGGQLLVTDLDDDPSTTSDRSVLDGSEPFFLVAKPGSRVVINNSLVSRCGGEPFRPTMGSAGVELMGSDFSLRGTVFRNSTGGLNLNATSGGRISGCTFSGMEYGIRGTMVGAVSIEECLFEEMDWGLT